MKKIAVIFDMDGVLVDSPKYVWKSFNRLLEPQGIHFNDEEIAREYLGRSIRDQINLWKEKYKINLDMDEFSGRAWKIQLDLMKGIKVDAYLLNLLNDLKLNGVPMGVGTSSRRFRAEKILDLLKIRSFFSVIVAADDVTKHKPDPELFLTVARKLDVKPENCAVIEDANSGIEAAKKGHMKVIGYLTKYQTIEHLKKSDLIISSFKELDTRKIISLFE